MIIIDQWNVSSKNITNDSSSSIIIIIMKQSMIIIDNHCL